MQLSLQWPLSIQAQATALIEAVTARRVRTDVDRSVRQYLHTPRMHRNQAFSTDFNYNLGLSAGGLYDHDPPFCCKVQYTQLQIGRTNSVHDVSAFLDIVKTCHRPSESQCGYNATCIGTRNDKRLFRGPA